MSNMQQKSLLLPESQPASVGIVSVTYNRCEPLMLLLSQIRTLTYPRANYEIFLVDNGSSDGTSERVAKEYGEVHLIRSEENLGTSAGFNLGIRQALESKRNFKYIWLLDSDAEVDEKTLTPLVSALEADPFIGIAGSTVYDPGNRERLVACGLHVNWDKGTVGLNKEVKAESDLVDVDLIPACSLLIRADLCRQLGLWDERFWLYWGDTDWCLRVIRQGYRVCSHTKSHIRHRDWANTRRNFNAPVGLYDDLRGGILFNLRHHPGKRYSGAKRLILKGCLKGALEYLAMRPNFSHAYEAAVIDFLRGDFKRSNLYKGPLQVNLISIDDMCRVLKKIFPENPRVLVSRISNETVRKNLIEQLLRFFPEARLVEQRISSSPSLREDFKTDYGHFLKHEMPRAAASLIKPRYEVHFTDIDSPHLYTLMSAKYTVFVDSSGAGVVCQNRRMKGVKAMIRLLLIGMKAAYIDLPASVKRNPAVRQAVEEYRGSAQPCFKEVTVSS